MYPEPLKRIISYFNRLPGIGRKTAERLALSLMSWKPEDVGAFSKELSTLRSDILHCPVCGCFMEAGKQCNFCMNPARDNDILCVVEQVTQILVIEKTGCYSGQYHVLGGKLSPMNGIAPEDLRIRELEERLNQGSFSELLIAISPDVEGEATANFLAAELARPGLSISKIAAGIPVGADLAYADSASLASAISGRRKIN